MPCLAGACQQLMHNPQVIAQFKAGRSFETGKLLIPDETKGRLELLYVL